MGEWTATVLPSCHFAVTDACVLAYPMHAMGREHDPRAVVAPQVDTNLLCFLVLCTGNFVMTVRTGNLLYTSGHLPISLEGDMTTGKVSCSLKICCC